VKARGGDELTFCHVEFQTYGGGGGFEVSERGGDSPLVSGKTRVV
jgi:hypothetical protein